MKEFSPIITIHGNKELYIENFKKIGITFNSSNLIDNELRNELVKIMTDESIVNIKGNNLYVEYMNDSDIKIIGNLSEVKLSEV